jgi:hypothetical protein
MIDFLDDDEEEGAAELRALVTLTFEVRSREPLPLTGNQLMLLVQDRMGWVTDRGPYGLGEAYRFAELEFGAILDGPVEWVDGSAPEYGWHCGDCRVPKDPNAGPCHGIAWGTKRCQSDDAQHHGQCWHQMELGPVPMSDRMA